MEGNKIDKALKVFLVLARVVPNDYSCKIHEYFNLSKIGQITNSYTKQWIPHRIIPIHTLAGYDLDTIELLRVSIFSRTPKPRFNPPETPPQNHISPRNHIAKPHKTRLKTTPPNQTWKFQKPRLY